MALAIIMSCMTNINVKMRLKGLHIKANTEIRSGGKVANDVLEVHKVDGTRKLTAGLQMGNSTEDVDAVPFPGDPVRFTAPGAQRPLVLLVEDDLDVRRVIRLQLVGLGYPVIEADHAADALSLLASVPTVGILISDVVMPGGMDGRALCREAHRHAPHVNFLLMSGYSATDNALPESHGSPPLLKKPFTALELQTALDELVA